MFHASAQALSRWAPSGLLRDAASSADGFDRRSPEATASLIPLNIMNIAAPLTQLIRRAQQGDGEAVDALFAATYADLSRLARSRLRAGRRPTLLDTGSLVHESYLRFAGARHVAIEDRVHFMHWAVRVMRSVIVDFARRRLAARRGAGAVRVTLDVEQAAGQSTGGESEILDVHQALDRIAAVDPRLSQVVEMRYFGGLTESEIAATLSVTERTVRRDWQKARLLLREALA
jgi:RNA polymerase sigma factor (TIGR02999 family)